MDETPPPLQAHITALLPPEWREGAAVTAIPGGFAVGFQDASGARHRLEARLLETGSPALVRGRRLGFSYLKVDEALDEALVVPRYQALIQVFLDQEEELARALVEAGAASGGLREGAAEVRAEAASPYRDERAAPEALAAILRDALPEAWRREVSATLSSGGYVLRFLDGEGRRHVLDARELSPGAPSFVSGAALGYSYTLVDPALDEASALEGYRAVLSTLAAREGEVLPWLVRAARSGGRR